MSDMVHALFFAIKTIENFNVLCHKSQANYTTSDGFE